MTTFPIHAATAEDNLQQARNTKTMLAWLWCLFFWGYGVALFFWLWTTVVMTLLAGIIITAMIYAVIRVMTSHQEEEDKRLRDEILPERQ
jgi:predicted PurR-regulated permease PerM